MSLALVLLRRSLMLVTTKTPDKARQRGAHFIYLLYSSSLSPECLTLPSLLPRYSVDYLGRQLLNQPLVCTLFFFRPSLPRFPHRVYNKLLWGFLRFFASPPPSPVLPEEHEKLGYSPNSNTRCKLGCLFLRGCVW